MNISLNGFSRLKLCLYNCSYSSIWLEQNYQNVLNDKAFVNVL